MQRPEDAKPLSIPGPKGHSLLAEAIDGPFANREFRNNTLIMKILQEPLDSLIPLGRHTSKCAELVNSGTLPLCVQIEKLPQNADDDIDIRPVAPSPPPSAVLRQQRQSVRIPSLGK